MVQTTSHIFSGKVDIESNLLVGSSHLFVDTTNNRVGITTADPDASLHVNGNAYVESNVGVGSNIELDGDTGIITATGFVGDGSQLTGLASNLEQVVNNGNVASVTVEFSNPGTSLVASGNVDVVGNVTALKFIGDGSGLTGVAANLQAITDNGNVTSNTVQFTNTGTSLTASGDVEVSGALRVGGVDVALSSDLDSNALRISNLETSNGYIWSNLADNASRISNLETSNGHIWSNLADNASRISNLESSNTQIFGDLAVLSAADIVQEGLITGLGNEIDSNAARISNLETSNGYIWSNLADNASRVSNLETSNGYIWSNLADNASRISNLETSNGHIWSNLADNVSRISNLETSNGYIWSNLADNASRVSNLETSNGYIWSNLADNASRVSNLETSNGHIWSNLADNASRISNLETSNGYLWSNLGIVSNDLADNVTRIQNLETATAGTALSLQNITDIGNATTNVVRFTNTATGLITTANIEVGGNVKIGGLPVGAVPYVASDNFLKESFISTTTDATVIASNLDVTGNIFMRGERFIIESETKLINDAIIGIANNNTTATTDVGILMQRPTANVALIHHGGTDKFTIGYTQNNLTATDITNDTTNVINVNILGELYVQNNMVLGSSGKYYGDGSTLTNVPSSTEHGLLTTRVGDIETALGGNKPSFPNFNLDGVIERGNTTSNTILLTNTTTGIVATGNVEALKFIGDGTSLTGLTLQHITDLGNVTTSNIEAAYFKGDGSELTNITLDNVVNKGNATSNVIHLTNATKGLEADGNIHASFFIGDGSKLVNVDLDTVVNKGNATSNTVQFTNTGTSLTASGNVVIDGNVSSTTAFVSNVATMGTTKTFVVTASGGYFYIDGVDRPALELHEHQTYIFDVSSLSAGGHVFKLSETAQGTHGGGSEYTDGVDLSVANKLILTVQTGASDLYYYCTTSGHSSMGNTSPCKVYSTAELIVSGRVVTSGNVDVMSNVNVVGNVYANTFIGDGSQLTGISGATTSGLQVVTTNGAITSDAIQFTNTGTSLTASGGITAAYFTGDGSNVAIGEMTATTIPYVDSNKQLRDSHIRHLTNKTIINSNLEIEGNLFVTGNTFAVNSENMVVNDRIIGIANNNTLTSLDMGLIMQYPQKNVAVIHHGTVAGSPHNGQFTIGYTQNSVTSNNIIQDTNNDITLNVWGSVISSNYFGDGTTLTGVALSNATIISNSAGITSGFAQGDLLYASATNTLGKFNIGSAGQVLKVNNAGTNIEWGTDNTGGSGSGTSQWSNVTVDEVYFDGNVGIANTNPGHDLSVGSNLFVDDDGSNVLVVDGNVSATKYYGDGSALTGISGTGGGQWVGTSEVYFDGNVGIANTNPGHDLSVGSNLFVDDDGSNVLVIDGNVSASYFVGDGSRLTGVSGTGGGQWVGTSEVYFDGNVGIANTDPDHDLSVGSNLFVDDDGSNVLVISGNAAMTALTLGEVSIAVSYGLDDILNTSNISSNTIQLTEQTTGLVATGNVQALKFIGDGSELTNIASNLDQIVNNGNVTSNTVQFSNATTGLVATANVEVGGELTVSGNATVSSNLTVSGNATVSSNLTVSGNVSDLNVVSNVNMLHTANTASIKLNSNVVAEFPRSKKLIKYPRVALTSAAQTGSGQQGYFVTRSTQFNAYNAWAAFDNDNPLDASAAASAGWASAGPSTQADTYSSSTGAATVQAATHPDNLTQGEWIQIQLPDSIYLHDIKIHSRAETNYTDNTTGFPKNVYLYGKNSSQWILIKEFTTSSKTLGDAYTEYINYTKDAFTHFVLVVKTIHVSGTTLNQPGWTSIGQIELFGVPEYDPEAHGTDVTVKSVANVPNTDWLEVYYDAKGLPTGAATTVNDLKPSSLGSALNSTATNNITVADDSFVFNGTDSYIKIQDLTNPSGAWVHSVTAWVKFTDFDSTKEVSWIGDTNSATNRQSFSFSTGGETVTMGIHSSNVQFRFASPLTAGKWHHVVYTYNGGPAGLASTAYHVFINGVEALKYSGVGTGTLTLPADSALWIGTTYNGTSNSNYFGGSMANFRIFNRALSSDEIYQLYAYQKEDFGHSTNNMTLKAGRLGIGTSEPRGALDVRGDAYYGCPVFFTAYSDYPNGSNFTYTGSTAGTVIVFNNTTVNKGGAYDISNGRCTFPISGYYEVFFRGGTANATDFHAKIYRNGIAPGSGGWPKGVMRLWDGSGNTYRAAAAIQFFYYFTAGEYIDVRLTNNSVFNRDNYNAFSVKYLSN